MKRSFKFRFHLLAALAAAALPALLAAPASADLITGWQKIDDFQSYATGRVNENVTGGNWVAHGNTSLVQILEDDGNQYIAMGHHGEPNNRRTASHALDEGFQLAPGGGTATYFMRTRFVEGVNEQLLGIAKPNVSTGSLDPTFNDYMMQVRVNSNGSVDVRDGGSFVGVAGAGSVPQDTWVNLWMVAHRPESGGNTWDLYMTTGNDSAVGSVPLQATIGFRTNLGDPLATVLLMGEGATAQFASHFDDIYFSSGQNLTLIPEPSSAALLVLAGLAMLLLRRRRK